MRKHSSMAGRVGLVSFCLFSGFAQAFYIPGVSPKSYADGETIPLFVNKVYSDNTQIQYAYAELPFVCPASGRKQSATDLISGAAVPLNLGEILRGDRITVSDYELKMGKDDNIRFLCSTTVDKDGLEKAREIVAGGYVAEWILDNLPGATQFTTIDHARKYYAAGFKMGFIMAAAGADEPRYFINNHHEMVIRYRSAPGREGQHGKKVIVGFEVYPKSFGLGGRNEIGIPYDLFNLRPMELIFSANKTSSEERRQEATGPDTEDGMTEVEEPTTLTIPYTYSVHYREEDSIEWSNRWDPYFVNQDDSSSIHWLAIINSLVIAGLLAAVVAVILTRTIRGEIKGRGEAMLEEAKTKTKRRRTGRSPARGGDSSGLLDPLESGAGADDSDTDESVEDVSGWKLVHADVFRTPSHGHILASLVGSGVQLLFMVTGLLILSCIGVLNPSFRGGFGSFAIGLFLFAGLFSGYFSTRIFKTFGGQQWQKNAMVTAALVPGLLFSTVFVLNLFVWGQASSTAIPFGSLVALVTLWLVIQVPLVYAGSWYGFNKGGVYEHPIKANAIPRQIPQPALWTSSITSAILAGLVPFLVIFIELLFVFKSVWQDKAGYYYLFGFLSVVSSLLGVSIIEVTVVSIYIQLCYENYHWWWHSFLVGASSSLWIFAYCGWYFFNHLRVQGLMSAMLFFSYSGLACAVYGLLSGTLGFLTAYAFVRKIYGAIKVD